MNRDADHYVWQRNTTPKDHRIIQVLAAEILNLSTPQITRLLQKFNRDGISGQS